MVDSSPSDRYSATPIDSAKYQVEYEVGRTRVLEALLPDGPGRAVDVGCGPGYFTSKLVERGWRTTAIDTDRSNLDKASVYAEEVRLGDAISVLSELPPEGYDLACALEVIEHMRREDGAALLSALRGVLRPGGRLVLSTPNRMSPEAATSYYWGEKLRGWRKWTAWDPTHVHVYTSFEIARLCRRQGFQVDRITGYWYRSTLPIAGVEIEPPWRSSSRFPISMFGFNTILQLHRR